jgi:hypothetical protein
MRLTYPAIAVAAATFAATLALAPALANVAQQLDLNQFWMAPADDAPVVTQKATPNCVSPFGKLVDALGNKDCQS